MIVLYVLYWVAVIGLTVYGVNCYVLMVFFARHYREKMGRIRTVRENFLATASPGDWPTVTVQLPIFNERLVVARLIHAVAQLDYPADKLDIQILDDSTDDTTEICRQLAAHYQTLGVNVAHIQRPHREGYKAGALRDGLRQSDAECVAIFDADFVPRADFLRQTVPFFFAGEKIGLVQTRWGHFNDTHSLLTRAQAVAIDGHFGVEQGGRCWGRVFLNFNGTGGVWRRQAIEDAGGWQPDTLTEDLDLSYRAQLAGWKVEFLPDVEVPAEIPADMAAFKSQQRRWAKGSIQTSLKLVPAVLRARLPWFVKFEAVVHLTHYLIHPLMLLTAALAVPLIDYWDAAQFGPAVFVAMVAAISVSTLGPSIMYLVAQIGLRRDWLRRFAIMPVLLVVGTGISVSNSRAVAEAFLGVRSGFIRTPKAGTAGHVPGSAGVLRRYRLPVDLLFLAEAAMCGYCVVGLLLYIQAGKGLLAPYLLLYACGYGTMALVSLAGLIRRLLDRRELATDPPLPLTDVALDAYTQALGSWNPADGPVLKLAAHQVAESSSPVSAGNSQS